MFNAHKKTNKIQALLRDRRLLYHTQDLGVLWSIDNPNTLYTIIKRYVKRGILRRIHKGLYSTTPIEQINPVHLGLASLHRYGYLSTESILAREGIIFQDIEYITLVSDVSRKFKLGGNKFLVRCLNPKYLYNDTGVITDDTTRVASIERAVADMLYFNPKYHFDARHLIEWEKVEKINQAIGY